MLKLVFLDLATLGDAPDTTALGALGELTTYEQTAPSEVTTRLQHAQVAITNKVAITAEQLAKLPNLRLICVAATGMNNIDLTAAAAAGVEVKNVAGYATESVAQWTFAALFALSMDLIHLNEAVYDGTYSQANSFSYWRRPFQELSDNTFGIIGLGAIGQRVATLATAFGAKVVYYSTSGKNKSQAYPALPLEELLATADVISINAPLNEKTTGLITYSELAKMKPSAYLLNSGRGGIVDENDLAKAIDEDLIAGAAMDVYTQEPLPRRHPYLGVKKRHKLLLSPHIAWAGERSRQALLSGVVENIRASLPLT